MTGGTFALGGCYACGRVFAFDPELVPVIPDANGVKQPICKTCMDRANALRLRDGKVAHPYRREAYPIGE